MVENGILSGMAQKEELSPFYDNIEFIGACVLLVGTCAVMGFGVAILLSLS